MHYRRPSGFTIVETAVVIAVISILVTMTIVVFNQVQRDSRNDRRTADITSLRRGIIQYYNDNGEYPVCPSSNVSCAVSVIAPSIKRYMTTVPTKDPAGTDYSYISGSNSNQFGLLVNYEDISQCKTGVNMIGGWWGSMADCKTVYTNRF